jgi:hypothetical protein
MTVGTSMVVLVLFAATVMPVEAAPPGGGPSCQGNSQSKGNGNSADCRAEDDSEAGDGGQTNPEGDEPGGDGETLEDAAEPIGDGELAEDAAETPGSPDGNDTNVEPADEVDDLGGHQAPINAEPGDAAHDRVLDDGAEFAAVTPDPEDDATNGLADDGLVEPAVVPHSIPPVNEQPAGLVLTDQQSIIAEGTCLAYSYAGGSLLEFERSLGEASLARVWVRDAQGLHRVLIVGAPKFVNDRFASVFRGGFSAEVPVAGCR